MSHFDFRHNLVLIGCTYPASSYSIVGLSAASQKIDADLRSVNVFMDKGADSDLPEPLYEWQSALHDAINRSMVFNDDSSRKVDISVYIAKLKKLSGVSTVTSIEARYDIIECKSGRILFSKSFSSSGIVTFGEASNGNYRIQESVCRAVKSNISQFLNRLNGFNGQL